MPKIPKRDLSVEDQLARGPVDLPFLMLTLLLLGVGLIMMFSASYASAYYTSSIDSAFFYISNQVSYAVLGLLFMYLVSKLNYQGFRVLSKLALYISIVLLALIYTPLGVEINEARRWINLGFVQFQPSEFAKVAVILYFSACLSERDKRKPRRWKNRTFTGSALNFFEKIGLIELLPYIGYLGIVVGLVLFQTHMSGAILILVGAAAVLFAGGISIWWFVLGGGVAGLALWVVVTLNPYMMVRLDSWNNPGYQVQQSLIAIGSGGLLGLGLGQSMQKVLYVPEPENDFIFAIVVEELGFVGACIVIGLFVLLILRGYWLALKARDRFGTLTIVGIITLLAVQVFLNIGVVTSFLPTTGISLPFFSYGGTALMIQLVEMGIILSISRQIPAQKQD